MIIITETKYLKKTSPFLLFLHWILSEFANIISSEDLWYTFSFDLIAK